MKKINFVIAFHLVTTFRRNVVLNNNFKPLILKQMDKKIKSAILMIFILLLSLSSYSFSQQTGYAMGYNGTLLRTTNSGTNWISQSVGTNQTFWDSWFVSAMTGWIVGGSYSQSSIILKTTNGGINWFQQPLNVNHWLTSVYFINSRTGWIAGAGHTILKTTNAGNNWIILTTDVTNLLIESIWFTNANMGFITGWQGTILKTTNGGNNWDSLISGTTSNLYTSRFFSNLLGYAAGSNGTILKTTNGGNNWIKLVSGTNNGIFSLIFLNRLTAYAAGDGGLILKTTDGGNNWKQQISGTNIRLECINFINQTTGWIVGGFGGDVILKTTNGGTNWIPQVSGSTQQLFCVYFLPTLTGIEPVSTELPGKFELFQNFPNPFNPSTIIKFSIPENGTPINRDAKNGKWKIENGNVTLKIYNILGKEVATLVNEKLNPGIYEVTFDARHGGSKSLNSGIYFYKLTLTDPLGRTGDFSETKKLVLLK